MSVLKYHGNPIFYPAVWSLVHVYNKTRLLNFKVQLFSPGRSINASRLSLEAHCKTAIIETVLNRGMLKRAVNCTAQMLESWPKHLLSAHSEEPCHVVLSCGIFGSDSRLVVSKDRITH